MPEQGLEQKYSQLGKSLRSERIRKGLSIEQVVESTKIRPSIVKQLEAGDFHEFDSIVYAKQYVKTYSKFLGLDSEKLVAMFRREAELGVTPTPKRVATSRGNQSTDQKIKKIKQIVYSRRFIISFLSSISLILITLFAIGQISNLLTPPDLTILSPVEIAGEYDGDIYIAGNSFRIEGETDPQTIVTFNSEVLTLEPGNIFSTPEIPLRDSSVVAIITATNQFGRTTTVRLNVSKGSTGISDTNKMSILVEIENEVTPILIRTDGKIVFNDRAFAGDLIQLEAENVLQIESDAPYNLIVTINGTEHQFTERNKIWELIDGNIIEKNI